MHALASRQPSADLNLRLLRHLVAYLHDHCEGSAITAVAAAGGVKVEDLWTATRWVSLSQFESILSAARTLVADDEAFKNACAYKVADVPGAVRFCMGALSPVLGYELGARHLHVVSSISAFKPEVLGHGRVRIRYETTKKESRLMCLSRQGQIEQLPTLWGMPPAHITETRCVARGDDVCTYDVQVYEPRRWLPAVLGAAAGVTVYMGLLVFGHTHGNLPAGFACMLLGGLLGHLYEYQRTSASNREAHKSISAAYVQAARDEANARRELFVLMQRQSTWGQIMEGEVVERAQALQDVAGELERLQAPRVANLRGPSHELGGPLDSLQSTLSSLRTKLRVVDADVVAGFDRLDADIDALARRLKEVGRTAASASELIDLMPQTLDTWPLVHELRTRLRALVHLPDVRVSVFAAREAPEKIRTDTALFNRIVDNLLVNAASQTQRGSIVVEVSGTPGFLTIKVSDTGPGLSEDDLSRVFRPMQRTTISAATVAAPGLSVVVQLMARIGGKLEVMSTPGRGATFWAHIPIDSEAVQEPTPTGRQAASDEFIRRIVTVRRSSHG
jgi:signal transduction histidine kinase